MRIVVIRFVVVMSMVMMVHCRSRGWRGRGRRTSRVVFVLEEFDGARW